MVDNGGSSASAFSALPCALVEAAVRASVLAGAPRRTVAATAAAVASAAMAAMQGGNGSRGGAAEPMTSAAAKRRKKKKKKKEDAKKEDIKEDNSSEAEVPEASDAGDCMMQTAPPAQSFSVASRVRGPHGQRRTVDKEKGEDDASTVVVGLTLLQGPTHQDDKKDDDKAKSTVAEAATTAAKRLKTSTALAGAGGCQHHLCHHSGCRFCELGRLNSTTRSSQIAQRRSSASRD